MASSIRIVRSDDHALLRHAVSMFLQEETILVIGEASNGEQLLQQIDNGPQPDVVLIDLDLPGISGIETTRKLRQMQPSLPIICMSVRNDASLITEIFQAGACGYLRKDSTIRELTLAIYTVHARQSTILVSPVKFLVFNKQAQMKPGNQVETEITTGGNLC